MCLMLPMAMLIDHDTGERLPRPLDPKFGACRCGNSSCQMWDGSSLVVNIGSVYVLDLNSIRLAIGLQLPGLTDLERERIDHRLNRNRLVKNDLIGISIDLKPDLLAVVVDQAPLLPPNEAPTSLIPSFQDNSTHDGVGVTLLPQGTPKRLADSQITPDAHSVVPELITC